MKFNKTILAAALCLGVAGASNASDVYLSGSTAMRGNVYNALSVAGPTNVFSSITSITTWGNVKASSANYMDFVGVLNGNVGQTTIHCSWSGSEAGIANVANSYGTFAKALYSTSAEGTGLTNNAPATTAHVTDLAMADNDQKYSRTLTPPLTGTNVAIITFEWLRNPGWFTGTNVTDAQIQSALGGICKLAVFSGNAADTNTYVYVSGRGNDSGTRVNAFGNTGFGIFNAPFQIELGAGQMVPASDGGYAEDWGFASGGTLAGTLGNYYTTNSPDLANYYDKDGNYITNTAGFSVIAYLGYNDAQTALGLNPPAVLCSFNGVPISANNIAEGTYTFWGNEYIYKNGSSSDTDVPKVYNLLQTTIPLTCYPNTFNGTAASLNGIAKSFMHCTRSGPLTAPGHN